MKRGLDMTPEQKRSVKSIILECRKVLESDIEQVLINYGIYIDKPWVNVKSLQNMNEEDENTRQRLEEVIHKLEKSGLTTTESVKQYIKEIVYTYVNRLSALRVLEVRGLIEEVLIPRKQWGDKSYGHLRFYEIAREYCKYQSDIGLAYFIQLIFGEVGEEIGMLFNTQDEYSLINPSSEALLKVIDLLCNQMDEDVWKQDEIIGWIYQYFNEKEKDDVFDRLYKKKQKIKAVDIPAATQLFTPDWIVKWIVDNSLGTLWQEIKEGKREGKKLEEIKLLDPACGSGHFLVQAYDLFYKFYEEERYNKGEIPYLILQNNLYGIDIDLRAIQLTAMVLFIKAKYSLKERGNDTNTKGKLSVNLVCADAVLLNGTRLERLKNQFKKNPTISRMIDIIYEEFKDTRLKGSLIQPEKKLYPLFEEYKDKIAVKEFKKLKKTKKSNQEALVEMLDADSLEEYKSKRNWSKEEEDLLGFLDLVYKEAIRANDITQQMFANEAVKSVKLVDIFMNEYDVVVTNPPYMGKRSMNDKLKVFIDHEYLGVGNDLYAVFISRCISFAKIEGLIGLITQNTFMFITTYKQLRTAILDNCYIKQLVHLGPKAFEDISGEKVNTAMYILQNRKDINSDSKSTFIKLDDIDNAEGKRNVLLSILDGKSTERVFVLNQRDFELIEGKSFVYWIKDEIRELFKKYKPLKTYAESVFGFSSGDDNRFFRYFWEVREDSVGKKWFLCSKGGGYGRYYKSLPNVVLWQNNGKEIKSFAGSIIRNEQLYFKKGINASLLGGINYSCRIQPEGYLFNVASVCVFPKDEDNYMYFLGYLNSSLAVYLLNCINPTNNVPPGSVAKLPVYISSDKGKVFVERLAESSVITKRMIVSTDETSNIFDKPFLSKFEDTSINTYIKTEILNQLKLQTSVDINSVLIDNCIFDEYNLSIEIRKEILNNLNRLPMKSNYTDFDIDNLKYSNNEISNKKLKNELENILDSDYNLYKISFQFDLNIIELFEYIQTYAIIPEKL